ncbi:MAG: ion transporter [Deltaproteobacteria bacterium]|nr:ion transporter [Deltaproteobacteria bacterium]
MARRDAWDAVAEGLEARSTRFLLAILIVLSLLPYPALEDALRPAFIFAFGLEIVLRMAVLKKGKAKSPRAEKFFLVVDLLAFGSFLPLHHFFDAPRRFLRILRIARLLVLVRFTRELAGDVYRVLTRREQLQQLGLVTAAVVALSFVTAVLLSNLGIAHDYDGVSDAPEGFWDHLWWAFRQVESPDNLVQNLRGDPFVVVVSLGLTITGIFVFSYLIGIGTNVVEQVLRAERRRPISYRGHTLVTGDVHEAEALVAEFVAIYEKNRMLRRLAPLEIARWLAGRGPRPRRRALPRMALLGAPDDAPSYLYESGMRWVVYRDGDGSDAPALRRVAAEDAKRLLILAEGDGEAADALAVARLSSFRSVNPSAHVFVEIRESENADLARAIGGEGTFVLDKPRFVGQFLCHHLIVPGMEELMSELLSARGREVYTHLFIDRGDSDALQRLADDDGTVDFERLAAFAYEKHAVTLLGVFLGAERTSRAPGEIVPVDRTTPWLNPRCDCLEPELAMMALTPGRVPTAALKGIFGIAETYKPLRDVAVAMVHDHLAERITDDPSRITNEILRRFDREAARGPRRVLVVGRNHALPPLVDALARFVPGVTVRVVTADPPDRFSAAEETALEQGGRCIVHPCGEGQAAAVAAKVFDAEGADALVFLSDPEAGDSADAKIGLRVLQFLRDSSSTQRAQLLVELVSDRSGEPLERQVVRLGAGRFSVTMVSTAQITNYFLVHSAFVPGLMGLYERLLGDRGQEIVRIPLREGTAGETVTFGAIQRSLANHGSVVIGLDSHEEGLVVSPDPDRTFDLAELRGLFVVADTAVVYDRLEEERLRLEEGSDG